MNASASENIVLHSDQQKVYNNIIHTIEDIIKTDMMWDNVVSLVGAAGTGKTFLTTQIIKYFIDNEYSVAVTTPTHKALSVLRDNISQAGLLNSALSLKTIHSFLNIKLFTDYTKGIQKFIVDKASKDNSQVDLLIVDESSMVSTELYQYIIEAVEADRVKAVLFVGDKFQLLPIDGGKNVLKQVNKIFELNQIVRQAEGSYIIKIATEAREIIKTKNYTLLKEFFASNFDNNIEFFHNINSFYYDYYQDSNWRDEDKIIASFKNSDVDAHNRVIRKQFWMEQGKNTEIDTLLVGDELVFHDAYTVNDRVVFHNGDLVKLSYVKKEYLESLDIYYWECKDEHNIEFKVVDPDSNMRYNKCLKSFAQSAKTEANYKIRKDKWKIYFELKNMFANVKYKFASTIHKLQGSTYETVYIDLINLEYMERTNIDDLYRLVYVAMTRASVNIKILIEKFESQNKIEQINTNVRELFDMSFLYK